MNEVDVTIVGGSFAGMSAALQLGRARRSVRLFDTRQPRNRFAETAHGFLGHDGRSPAAIGELGRSNLAQYPTIDRVDAAVSTIKQEGESFIIQADDGETTLARRIILAYGVRDELPVIDGLSEAWGRNVMQCPYCHGYEVRDRRLGVLYTTEASLHQVKILPDWSPDLTVFANGHDIDTESVAAFGARGIRLIQEPVVGLDLEGGLMTAVRTDSGRHPLDGLFVITQTRPASDLADQLGCAFEQGPFGPYVRVDALQQTSVNGVYAAGDLARPIHQSVWAAADGSSAGVFCHQSLLSHENPYQKKVA